MVYAQRQNAHAISRFTENYMRLFMIKQLRGEPVPLEALKDRAGTACL
jgi:hypothetical protein